MDLLEKLNSFKTLKSMWPSHLSMPDLGLIHWQQPENFGLYIKPPFHHREKHSTGADSPDLGPCALLPVQAASPIAQQATGCHDADGTSVAPWVCVAGFPPGVTPPGALPLRQGHSFA